MKWAVEVEMIYNITYFWCTITTLVKSGGGDIEVAISCLTQPSSTPTGSLHTLLFRRMEAFCEERRTAVTEEREFYKPGWFVCAPISVWILIVFFTCTYTTTADSKRSDTWCVTHALFSKGLYYNKWRKVYQTTNMARNARNKISKDTISTYMFFWLICFNQWIERTTVFF